MTAKNLGVKYTCYKCSTRFYDMKKPQPECPKCGTNQRNAPAVRSTPTPASERKLKPVPVEPAEEEGTAEVEATDDVLLDDEELDEFGDDEIEVEREEEDF